MPLLEMGTITQLITGKFEAIMDFEPPFLEFYKTLCQSSYDTRTNAKSSSMVESPCELPLIDYGRLNSDHIEREECMKEVTEAAKKWGFFQVVNHGVSHELLESLRFEQMKVFHRPFGKKSEESSRFINYKWGNPFATNRRQFSWSEAFHVSLPHRANMVEDQHRSLRSTVEAFAKEVGPLAERLAKILAEELNVKASYFGEKCLPDTSFLRLNRYPLCPIPTKVFGLLAHSDSSFLTIVFQDQVGGLQLMRDGKWVGVKPNPQALLVNIGDLFQALSNGVYKSIKHRVVAAEKEERFSVAYFYCPSNDAVIESHDTPRLYRNFTFTEYKQQNERDVKQTGDKVGLSRFLL